jgi:predicted RNase H-like HicB family nuclease
MYKYLDEGVHAEVLDFPGVISFGENLEEARRLLASALVDMAETNLLYGEPLPRPDPTSSDPDADIEEPIHLLLTAAPPTSSTTMAHDQRDFTESVKKCPHGVLKANKCAICDPKGFRFETGLD